MWQVCPPLIVQPMISATAAFLKDLPAIATIALFFAAWFLFWLPVAIPLAIRLRWRPPQLPTPPQKIALVLSLYAFAPLLLWAIAAGQETPFSAYGLSWSWATLRSLLLGLALGSGGVVLAFGLEWVLGWAKGRSEAWSAFLPVLFPTLAVALLISGIEELVFRGFLLNQLQREGARWFAAIVSSLIFAVLHLVWDGWRGLPQLPGLGLMGLVLVLARWADGGSLGMACGLHAGWVWAIASLDTAQVLPLTGTAPEWVTGIGKQPLAGAIGILLMVATAGIVWAIGRGFWMSSIA